MRIINQAVSSTLDLPNHGHRRGMHGLITEQPSYCCRTSAPVANSSKLYFKEVAKLSHNWSNGSPELTREVRCTRRSRLQSLRSTSLLYPRWRRSKRRHYKSTTWTPWLKFLLHPAPHAVPHSWRWTRPRYNDALYLKLRRRWYPVDHWSLAGVKTEYAVVSSNCDLERSDHVKSGLLGSRRPWGVARFRISTAGITEARIT